MYVYMYVCMYVGECTVQCPRLPGECEVACIATADGSTTMASEKIAIIDPQNKAGIYCMYVCMHVCVHCKKTLVCMHVYLSK